MIVLTRAIGAAIVRQVSAETGIAEAAIMGQSRAARPSEARRLAMVRLRQITLPDGRAKYSFPQIGAFFERDHTSVLQAVRRHRQLAETVTWCWREGGAR